MRTKEEIMADLKDDVTAIPDDADPRDGATMVQMATAAYLLEVLIDIRDELEKTTSHIWNLSTKL